MAGGIFDADGREVHGEEIEVGGKRRTVQRFEDDGGELYLVLGPPRDHPWYRITWRLMIRRHHHLMIDPSEV